MSFLSKIINKIAPEREQKSASSCCNQSFSEMFGYCFASNTKWQWLTCAIAWKYYENVSPVNHAVSLRADKFCSIFPDVYDFKEERFLNNQEVARLPISGMVKLLKNPSSDETTSSFLKPCSISYPITGDILLLVKAISKEAKPVSIEYVNPCDIEIVVASDEKHVGKYEMKRGSLITNFFPEETKTGTRFYNKDGRWELYHIRTFNPNRGQTNTGQDLRGMSTLNSIYIEIEQHIEGNYSNKSTLKNGVRPSGLMEVAPLLEPSQRDSLKKQIEQHYSGSSNAGKVLVMDGLDPKDDGLKTKFTQLSINNKDMDFANLLKMDKRQIYNSLSVPLPLVEGESQTFSNYQHADAILYTGEVLPFSSVFYSELTRFLLPRYDKSNSDRYTFRIDRNKIPALDVVNTEIETKKINTGLLTYDEGRKLLGFGSLKTGGDVVYQPSTLVPVGVSEQAKSIAEERLVELMQLKSFSKEEIEAKKKELKVIG